MIQEMMSEPELLDPFFQSVLVISTVMVLMLLYAVILWLLSELGSTRTKFSNFSSWAFFYLEEIFYVLIIYPGERGV
jgi:hypothetical protein